MLKKIKLSLFSIICLFGSLVAEPNLPQDLPTEFYVKQCRDSLLTSFDIETKQLKLGSVQRQLFSWTTEYDFYDYNGKLQAKAKMRFLSRNAVFDVVDANEVPIGTIEENLNSFLPNFDILSPRGERLGSAQMNFWGTEYTITSPLYKEPIARLTRPFFRLQKHVDWTATIHNLEAISQNGIDPRLFVVVMAFQTDRGHWLRLSPSTRARGTNAKEKLKKVRRYLKKKKKELYGITCLPQHFEAVEKITRAELEDASLQKNAKKLALLLDSNTLSPEEKRALYLMLKERLKTAKEVK